MRIMETSVVGGFDISDFAIQSISNSENHNI